MSQTDGLCGWFPASHAAKGAPPPSRRPTLAGAIILTEGIIRFLCTAHHEACLSCTQEGRPA